MIKILRSLPMILRLSFTELSSNFGRTIITSLGIFMGVASLLVNLSFVRAMDDDMKESMMQAGGINILTVRKKEAVSSQEKLKFAAAPGISFKQMDELKRRVPEVETVIRSKNLRWNQIFALGNSTWSKHIAIDREYWKNFNYKILHGRMISDFEMDRSENVCIIGKNVAERLFGTVSDAMDKEIKVLGKHNLRVIGIIGGNSGSRGYELLLPYSFYTKSIGLNERDISEVRLVIDTDANIREAITKVTLGLLSIHRGVENFEIDASLDKMKDLETSQRAMQILFLVIAGITLLIGAVSIMNIMFATIGNRIREIGIRKAIGAKKTDIFLQFIVESVAITTAGAIPGLIVGTLVTLFPEGALPFTPRLTPGDYLLSIGFTILTAVVSGTFPALKAARMQVVEALRY